MNRIDRIAAEGETREEIQASISHKLEEIRDYETLFEHAGWKRLCEVRRRQIETAFNEWSNMALAVGESDKSAIGQAAVVKVAREFLDMETSMTDTLKSELQALVQRIHEIEDYRVRRGAR